MEWAMLPAGFSAPPLSAKEVGQRIAPQDLLGMIVKSAAAAFVSRIVARSVPLPLLQAETLHGWRVAQQFLLFHRCVGGYEPGLRAGSGCAECHRRGKEC
jgi:hypothetical protein